MLSYQDFTPKERRAIVVALERQRDKIDHLIECVSIDSFEIVVSPAEARRIAELIRSYYMPIAHKIESHPGYEPE